MPRLFKRSQRYNVAKNSFLARIVLLDNTSVEINLLPDVNAADCLEKVAQSMDIQEIQYFGLQYQTKSENMRWVNRNKSLRKQLEKYAVDGARNAELRLGVQYYVTDVTKLQHEITRYLYFLQLKHLVLKGDLPCSHDLAVKLSSYALQAEFGDHDEQKHTMDYLSDYVILPPNVGPPSQVKSLTERALKLHQKHRGLSPASAEFMYIKLAQQLPEYGHESFQALDGDGVNIWIGACFIGIFVKHANGQPTVYFKWPDVFRMKVRDKNFGIETPGETVYFKMPDNSTAQYVLRMMISQHKFYQNELQNQSSVNWTSQLNSSKKKSRSFHDLRSTSVLELPNPELHAKAKKRSSFQRPLHRHFHRETSLSPTGDPARLKTVSDSDLHGVVSHRYVSDRSARLSDLDELTDLGPPLICVDERQAPSEAPVPSTSKYSPRLTPRRTEGKGLLGSENEKTRDYSSQESITEVLTPLKAKHGGSLEDVSMTPPRSLKIRTYSIAEQQEQAAPSGTHDKRGDHLVAKLNSGKFYSEYELLMRKKVNADVVTGQKPENIHKNRYKDILPYEETRVKLNPGNNTSQSDYINASFVEFSVAGVACKYIVSQGPMEHTCTDFWQMIWEQSVSIILMLTNEVEDGRPKCFRYFPPDKVEGQVHFDQYLVSLKFLDKSKTVVTRGFVLKHIPSEQEREITLMHYIDWPDHGIPEDPQPFLDFLIDVRSLRQRFDPSDKLLVHCSAGVGRSGVVVLMDMLMAKVDCGDDVDVPKCLKELRQQRMHLVQMVGQYKFIYSAIVQYIRRARLI